MNLRDHIEREIRNAILRGAFKPGERLVESVIADQMGVSRAPVREVLSALVREGLVVNIPRHGNFVIDFTEKDIEEIYSLRLILEIGALRRAVPRATESALSKMQQIVQKLGEATARNDGQEEIVSLDLSFHDTIYRMADHSRMYATWDSIRVQTHVLIGVTTKTHIGATPQPVELHQAILNVIRTKDLQQAEAMLTEHIVDAQRRAIRALQGLHTGAQAHDKER